MREQLTNLLARLNERSMDIFEFRSRLNTLLKGGVKQHLSSKEASIFKDFVAWYLDMYDPKLPPRPGILGRIKDRYSQLLHGEYRVDEADVRNKAEELRQLLLKPHKEN
jgi:hypothetical protein